MNWAAFGVVLGGGLGLLAYIVGLAFACAYVDDQYGEPAGALLCVAGLVLFFATVAGLTW